MVTHREVVRYLGDDDSATLRMPEDILAMEEEHAEDLVALLAERGKHNAKPQRASRKSRKQ